MAKKKKFDSKTCPFCGSKNICTFEEGAYYTEDGELEVSFLCNDCDTEWDAYYKCDHEELPVLDYEECDDFEDEEPEEIDHDECDEEDEDEDMCCDCGDCCENYSVCEDPCGDTVTTRQFTIKGDDIKGKLKAINISIQL